MTTIVLTRVMTKYETKFGRITSQAVTKPTAEGMKSTGMMAMRNALTSRICRT